MFSFRKRQSGFTLVELLLEVREAFAYRRGRRAPQQMWAGSVTYYETDHTDSSGNAVAKQFPGTAPDELDTECGCQDTGKCPGGSAKFQDAVWVGLQFSISDPHLYMPHYTSKDTASKATFTATATGDLDCNKRVSTFTSNGAIDGNGDVTGSRAPIITNELE